MPKIFELYGYPLTADCNEAKEARQNATCPFYGGICDGGGNRYLSGISLDGSPELLNYYVDKTLKRVQAGVCSIQLDDNEAPWVVCPRRLLVLGHNAGDNFQFQKYTESRALEVLGYQSGVNIGVWKEVKISEQEESEGDETETENEQKSFDYTFDYILAPIGSVPLEKICSNIGGSVGNIQKQLSKNGYVLAQRDNKVYVENFPVGPPSIIEIMTSSTSGGNLNKRTRIAQAFEDALLGKKHNAPSINKRQVWARMASQLIVKSQTAIAWGGTALWILQDNLADYVSASTALNLYEYLATAADEVNILSLSYGKKYKLQTNSIIELEESNLFAGPMYPKGQGNQTKSFQDIVRASYVPSVNALLSRLVSKKIARIIQAK